MSLILAISTSYNIASIAIIKSGILISERTIDDNTHSKSLLPIIDELLSAHNVSVSDVDMFAVDTGPGSFTGVRIGVATANGLGFGTNKPVLGVCSLLALRYAVTPATQRHVATIIDAHNDNVYAAVYLGHEEIVAPYATDIEEFMSVLPQDSVCIGSGALCHRMSIAENFPAVRCLCEPENSLSARHIGFVACEAITNGTIDMTGFVQAVPTYLKLSQAELAKKKKEE